MAAADQQHNLQARPEAVNGAASVGQLIATRHSLIFIPTQRARARRSDRCACPIALGEMDPYRTWRIIKARRRRYEEECRRAIAEGREPPPYRAPSLLGQLCNCFDSRDRIGSSDAPKRRAPEIGRLVANLIVCSP